MTYLHFTLSDDKDIYLIETGSLKGLLPFIPTKVRRRSEEKQIGEPISVYSSVTITIEEKNLLVKPDSSCTVGKRAELNGYLELNCFEPSLTGSKAMCAWLNGEVYPDGDIAVVDGIVNTTTGEHEYAVFCPKKKRWIPVSYEDWNNFEQYCDYPEFGAEEIPDEEIPDFGL